ncbi:Dps family protein [Pedobacter cryophilus]|uniref:DNA starvation/stationary phase protection protein n=1 Tax=Pedobacter cryophilus TaxID=2571271 RepID=A0A4U1BUH7_9SPHI|nr:DNA starvation/stationary phase protection protein [Pedobacter cryophilus]TKB96018.1 DNA starvation/stationary phase protection protein [Pedobacter cryophilus]
MSTVNKIGLEDKKVIELVDHLNLLLANYQIHYQKVRGCHWNVRGHNFFNLHVKFEELYDNAQLTIDELAERVLTLGKSPYSTYADYIELSEIKEIKTEGLPAEKMVEAILDDFKKLIVMEREVIENATDNAGDEGTADMIIGFLRFKEKTSWMLRAWVGK